MAEASRSPPGVDLLGEPDGVVDHVTEVDGGGVAHERLARAGERREDLALRGEPLAGAARARCRAAMIRGEEVLLRRRLARRGCGVRERFDLLRERSRRGRSGCR